jgi:glutathione S-transferase
LARLNKQAFHDALCDRRQVLYQQQGVFMKLYYSKGACSLSVRILVHELGIACDYEAVNLSTKKTESGKDYLTINPKGAVPALELKEGVVLTENVAIQQYLAYTHGAVQLLPPVGDFKRYRVVEWLGFINSDIHKGFSPLFNPKVPDEIKETIFKPALKRNLRFIDRHFDHNQYLMQGEFTVADIYLFVILTWVPHVNISLEEYPHVQRYFNEIKTRKAVVEAFREEGL